MTDEPASVPVAPRRRTPAESLEWIAGELRANPERFEAGTVAILLENLAQRLRDETGPILPLISMSSSCGQGTAIIDFPADMSADAINRFRAAWAGGPVEYTQAGRKLDG